MSLKRISLHIDIRNDSEICYIHSFLVDMKFKMLSGSYQN